MFFPGVKPSIKGLIIKISDAQYLGSNTEIYSDPNLVPVFNYDEKVFEMVNEFRQGGINAKLIDYELDVIYGPQLTDCTDGYMKLGLIVK